MPPPMNLSRWEFLGRSRDVWKQYRGYCTDIFFDEVMRFVRESSEAGAPFLTCIPTGAGHDPYVILRRGGPGDLQRPLCRN